METDVEKMKLYEAMFLVDSDEAASDWEGVIDVIGKMLDKADAEIVSIEKWDDRRLAYEIKGRSRGTYILCCFRADGDKIREIERAVQLSERIMRVLILRDVRTAREDSDKAGGSEGLQAQEGSLGEDDEGASREDTSAVEAGEGKRKAAKTAEAEAEGAGEPEPDERTEEEIERVD